VAIYPWRKRTFQVIEWVGVIGFAIQAIRQFSSSIGHRLVLAAG
jgi:hypothetical protein